MRRILQLFLAVVVACSCVLTTFAHSGRTDSSGGHKDNKNASGLGSYHYHHGVGPHLHPNGVCSYDTTTTTTTTTPPPQTTPQPAAPAATAGLTAAETAMVEQAKQAFNQGSTFIKVENQQQLSLALLQALAKTAANYGKALTVNCDTIVEQQVVLRLAVNPTKATKAITVTGAVSGEQVQTIQAKFLQWFGAQVQVVGLNQPTDFGMVVEVVAKVDLAPLNTNGLVFYVYDAATGKYTPIAAENCWVDDNGFVHVKTSLSGYIIVADKAF